MNWKKFFMWTGIVGGTTGGIIYAARLRRTSEELETVNTINIHKLNLKGLIVRVDVQLKNPTRTKFKIKYPFVKLLYKGVTVGTSNVVDKDIPIEKFSEAVAEKIMIGIPVKGVFSVVFGMVKSLLAGEEIKITSKTITEIDLGWKKIPYQKTEESTLKI